MKRVRVETSAGRLDGIARDDATLSALAEIVSAAEREQRVIAALTQVGADALWLKGDHLPGKARLRHSLRRLLGIEAPRVRELRNIEWLEKRLFRTPRALAAAVLVRGGLVRYQVLALEPLPPHFDLLCALNFASPFERAAWLAELAREIARMHALHFVHRNLFLRNVLVESLPAPAVGDRRRLIFVDVWRGGAAFPRRDSAYDLGCLMLEGAGAMLPAEQRSFFALYAAERAVQKHAVDLRALLASANARRTELVARLARDPARRRSAAAPLDEWNWREALES